MSYLAFYFDQMPYSTICRIDELSYSTNYRADEMVFDEMSWKRHYIGGVRLVLGLDFSQN